MKRLAITLDILVIAACLVSSAFAQVKTSDGTALSTGLPMQPTADFDGGKISRGRPAQCVIDTDARQGCVFYPRNGNGSFAIDVDGMAYYADKVGPNEMTLITTTVPE